jgi:carboxypeptidase C (cathepsin A)
MRIVPPLTLLLVALALSLVPPARAAEDAAPDAVDEPVRFETSAEGRFGGERVRYRVEAGEMHLTDADGAPTAALFSVAYVAEGADRDADETRPVTFVWNGGPGSASLWLHMGLLGPKRVRVASAADADDGAPPYRLEDNPATILDLTDLVFVDPIGTGYSRVVGAGKTEAYWGQQGDTDSMAQFIRRWVTEHDRWNAPRWIIGESFGTTRAAAVADTLMGGGQDMALSGIVMISQAMDYTGSTSSRDNLIAYVTYLPTLAATAWYHGRAGAGLSLEEVVERARAFATETYLPALFRGSSLPENERRAVAATLSELLGLDVDHVLRADLRVTVARFTKELLRDQGLAVGRLDGRYTADDPDDTGDSSRLGDAASNAITSAYTAALNAWHADLGIRMDRPYLTSNRDVGRNWDYSEGPGSSGGEPAYVNTARHLSNALRKNGDLRVLVANGYYDLVTPFFDAEYTVARHEILADRIDMRYYAAGHMMYVRDEDFDALLGDIRSFYAGD